MKNDRLSPDVQLIEVSKRFDGVLAVDRVSFEVQRGEFLSLIGPSGSGKTTTMRLIAGLEVPDSGEILIKGTDVSGVPAHNRNIGVVFQSFALLPHLTVIQNVEYGLRMRGESRRQRREKALRSLRVMGMEELAKRNIGQLSGGQKQRVGLARALVIQPDLLLLDEPFGSLDAKLRIDMQSELKALQRQMDVTFLHISHNQSEALAMADRIAVMHNGRIEQMDTPRRLFNVPRTQFVAEFVGRNNIFEGTVREVRSEAVVVETSAGTFTLARHDQPLSAGQRVKFVVRADRLRTVNGTSHGGTNRVAGELKGLEYYGSTLLLLLALPDGSEIKVEGHESLALEQGSLEHGAEVSVSWTSSDAHLLP